MCQQVVNKQDQLTTVDIQYDEQVYQNTFSNNKNLRKIQSKKHVKSNENVRSCSMRNLIEVKTLH